MTEDIENQNFMKPIFKAIYLLLLSSAAKRQILMWSQVEQIKSNILVKVAKIHMR